MFKKVISICLIAMTIFGLTACGEKEPDAFSAMTMIQKRNFVSNYISETYNLETGVTSDIVRLPDSEYSYAIARTPEGKQIHCWIKDDKTVADDKFLIDMEENFNKIFEDVVSEYVTEYKLMCDVKLVNPPTEEMKSMGAQDILETDGTNVTVNILITRESRSKINAAVAKKFDNSFDFVNGKIYVYVVDDLESATFSGLNTVESESSCQLVVAQENNKEE